MNHLREMYGRNIPYKQKTELPLIAINGPIPYDPREILELLIRRADRFDVDYTALSPKFKQETDIWTFHYSDGMITKLPYGFVMPITGAYEDRSFHDDVQLVGPVPQPDFVKPEQEWTCFDGEKFVTYKNINDLMEDWTVLRLQECIKEIEKLAEEDEDLLQKQAFIRRLYVNETEETIDGRIGKRYFWDYREDKKLRVLQKEYGHTNFANIPVSKIGPDYFTDAEKHGFIDAHKLLLRKLRFENSTVWNPTTDQAPDADTAPASPR
jgi:hypothetical protein